MSQRARSGSGGVTGHRGCPVQRLIVAAVLTLVSVVPVSAAGPPEVDFAREVQPLLARRCYSCHGPDTREAGLRLDDRAAATARLESGGRAIVPGEPAGQARTGQARTSPRPIVAACRRCRRFVTCCCTIGCQSFRRAFRRRGSGAMVDFVNRVRHGGRPLLPRSHGT